MIERVPRIAVVGSINMDLVVRTDRLPRIAETVLGESITESCGGKGANQAVAAARLGAHVSLIGCLGSDPFGTRLKSGLEAAGVDLSGVVIEPESTSGVAVVTVDATGANAITVVAGANRLVTPALVERHRAIIEAADVLLVQLEVPLPAVLAAIQIARESRRPVIVDPAPALINPPPQLLDVDVICPNEVEAATLLGLPTDRLDQPMQAARELVKRGARHALITLGDQGAVWCDVSHRCHAVAAYPTVAVDSTAAGDALAGALAVALAERRPMPEAVDWACAAGSLAVSRPGAQAAMPTRSEVDRLASRG